MTDFTAPDTTFSTVVDTGDAPSPGGGGQMPISEPEKPTSARDAIEAEFKNDDRRQADASKRAEVKPDDAKPVTPKDEKPTEGKTDEKAEAEEKPNTGAEKPEGDKAAEQKPETEQKPEQRERKHVEAPSKFLPRAKELWRNVPREVQQEWARLDQEREAETAQFKESNERYGRIKDIDDLARSNGRDLRDSLVKVNQIENLMQRNPIAGINAMLMEIGPRKADGQPVSLFEVAQHIVQNGPEAYQQSMRTAQEQPQQQQPNREVEALKQQVNDLHVANLEAQVIAPFARENPRYHELQEDIAFFLQSGKIPANLGLHDRLAAAYDMAVRINPASHDERFDGQQAQNQDRVANSSSEPARRVDDDLSGSRSIRSAPGLVSDQDTEPTSKKGESHEESLRATLRSMKRA
jgi:hypothetical protein